MVSSVLAIQSYTTTFHPTTTIATYLHLVISYTALPYAVKGSVAANRVAADGCCLMTAKDKFHQLPKQASGGGGANRKMKRKETGIANRRIRELCRMLKITRKCLMLQFL